MNASYPLAPGAKERGPDSTSRDAAEASAVLATVLREQCERVLRDVGPMSSDQIAVFIGQSILAVRPRLSELVAMGRAVKTAERTMNSSGHSARIYALAPRKPSWVQSLAVGVPALAHLADASCKGNMVFALCGAVVRNHVAADASAHKCKSCHAVLDGRAP